MGANPIVEQMGRLSAEAEEATISRFHNWADEGLQTHVTDKITKWGDRTPTPTTAQPTTAQQTATPATTQQTAQPTATPATTQQTTQPTITVVKGPDGNKVMTVASAAPSELQKLENLYLDMTGETFPGNLTEAEANNINSLLRKYINNGLNENQDKLLNCLRVYISDDAAYNFVDKLTAHLYTPKANGIRYSDPRNWAYIIGNWGFRKQGSAKAKQEGTYLFINDPKAEAIRKKMYHRWNPFASWLRGNKLAARDAIDDSIDKSIEIFNRQYPSLGIDLGVGSDYTTDLSFSALPVNQNGYLIEPNWGGATWPNSGTVTINLNNGQFTDRIITDLSPTAVHEGNHLFTLNPTLEAKYPHLFGVARQSQILDDAYPSGVVFSPGSNTIWEKSAENARIRHMLGLSEEEIKNLPTETFIRIEPNGSISTIYGDIMQKDPMGYLSDYDAALRKKLNSLIQQNIQQGGKGLSDVFPTFAKDFSDDMKNALINAYKTGGKL